MKDGFRFFMGNIVSLAFAIGGIVLAFYGIDGWGWAMFCSLLTFSTIEVKGDSKKDD